MRPKLFWQNFVRTRFGLPRHIYGVTNFMNFKVKQITLNSKDSSENSQWKIVNFSSEKMIWFPVMWQSLPSCVVLVWKALVRDQQKNETSDFLVKNSMRQRVSEKISPIQKRMKKFCDMKEFWINHCNQNNSSIYSSKVALDGNSRKCC